ncbi:Tfp pilus assembly protein FimT/FimU [Acidithiobacillus sp. IBUN Pt1247-S3]|uniref:pilus assembly FimT family protein n=1 Tax=Acidithiobacillus sp. IBUN Pt1247-S3 TaxID=3166642 RepID=UPI0034E3E822
MLNCATCHHQNRGFRDRQGGFTFLEMMVILAILGIVAAIAVPDWSSALSGSQLLQMVQSVRQAAGEARDAAMVTNTPVAITASGCQVSFAYVGTPPAGAAPLPATISGNGGWCQPDFSLQYTPEGMLVNAQQTPTSVTWHLSPVMGVGISSTLVLDDGGGIDVPGA